jgi:hypothetical protein
MPKNTGFLTSTDDSTLKNRPPGRPPWARHPAFAGSPKFSNQGQNSSMELTKFRDKKKLKKSLSQSPLHPMSLSE